MRRIKSWRNTWKEIMMNSLAPHHTENNRPRAVPPFRRIAPRKKTQIKKSARKKIDVGIRGPICESHSQSFAQCANNVYFFFADSFRHGEGFHRKGETARKLWKERPPLGKVNKGSLAPTGKCKSLWWKERLSAESNPWLLVLFHFAPWLVFKIRDTLATSEI